MGLNRSDFDVHGYTTCCAGCRAITRSIAPQSHCQGCPSRTEDGLHPQSLVGQSIRQKLAERAAESGRKRTRAQPGVPATGATTIVDQGGGVAPGGTKQPLDDGEPTQPPAQRRREGDSDIRRKQDLSEMQGRTQRREDHVKTPRRDRCLQQESKQVYPSAWPSMSSSRVSCVSQRARC